MAKQLPDWVPGLQALSGYRPAYIVHDVLAGAVLAALVATLAVAYAPLAGLQPIYGLYASLMALLAYAVLGPSRVLVLGPDSSTAPLVAAAIIPLAQTDPALRATLAGMLAVLVGAIVLFVGIARLGFITDLLAKPVRIGYLNGVAVVIVVSQLPKLLGFQIPGGGIVQRASALVLSIDQTVAPAFAMGAIALALLLLGRYFVPQIPVVLAVVLVATVYSAVTDAAAKGVATVGVLPGGLPDFVWPAVSTDDVMALVAGAVGIAAISLADSSVLAESLAARYHYDSKPDEEFIALGVANVAAGVFQGFPVSGSLTRSAVNVSTGAKTQMAGAVAALFVGVMLVWLPGLLAALPLSVLAAVVIMAGLSLTDVKGTVRLWYLRRTEFTLCIAAFAAVVLLGVMAGVFVAIALSLLNFVRRQWRPHDAVLGRVPGVKGYHDITDFTDARQVPGLLLYRFDAPLFFANARVFRARLYERIAEKDGLRRVVLVAEPLIDVDTTAADVLAETLRDLGERGIEVGFSGLRHNVREQLERYGIMRQIDPGLLYPTIGLAVRDFVSDTGVEWLDWEEASGIGSEQEPRRARPHR